MQGGLKCVNTIVKTALMDCKDRWNVRIYMNSGWRKVGLKKNKKIEKTERSDLNARITINKKLKTKKYADP